MKSIFFLVKKKVRIDWRIFENDYFIVNVRHIRFIPESVFRGHPSKTLFPMWACVYICTHIPVQAHVHTEKARET